MNLKKEYNNLYRHWLAEFDQAELTPFFQEDFNSYKNSVNKIKVTEFQDNDAIKNEILKSYKDHFEYLFEDLLKIRKIKIMNAALALQEINLDHIVEPEKIFYQNLISSIKGYNKLKRLSILEDYRNEDVLIEPSPYVPEEIETEIDTEIDIEIKSVKQAIEDDKNLKSIDQGIEEIVENKIVENYNYIVIRFLKDTPPLVGIDLKNYGPFNADDLANIPYKNAIILINEKFAEKVEFS
jgi:DNA replication initiation complex subunit (GINS family)